MTEPQQRQQRVAVIGAGPSGLAQLRAFQTAKTRDDASTFVFPEVVCYEKQANWGGMWNYTWMTGVDEYGEAIHSGMYRYLWSNGPKECLEFADYSFEEHFGHPIPSYPPRAVLWDYIQGRVIKANVRGQIRFQHAVRNVEFHPESGQFTLHAHDLLQDRNICEQFDWVVVATGHFSFPSFPQQLSGLNTFEGRILHSHDFRDALEFRGKDLLIVGASYSAEDIASQCYKYGARSITFSCRSGPMGYRWPSNFSERPLLSHVDRDTVHFVDGTQCRVDAIIFCTGFRHNFPFLPDSLRLKTNNRLWPLGLYKGIFWENNPKLIYLGMQDQYYTFNMFDAQAWYARDVIMGKITLPPLDVMTQHSLAWREREEALDGPKDGIVFQGDYVKELLAEVDYPSFDIDAVNEAFFQWKHHKEEDIMGYRDQAFASIITGNRQPVHHTPWLQAMDDSMETYLSHKPEVAQHEHSKVV